MKTLMRDEVLAILEAHRSHIQAFGVRSLYSSARLSAVKHESTAMSTCWSSSTAHRPSSAIWTCAFIWRTSSAVASTS